MSISATVQRLLDTRSAVTRLFEFIKKYDTQFNLFQPQNLENTTIHIKISISKLRLLTIYKRTSHHLNSNLDTLLNTFDQTIVVRDLNSKHRSWNSHTPNPADRVLARYADTKEEIAIITPKFFEKLPSQSNSLPRYLKSGYPENRWSLIQDEK